MRATAAFVLLLAALPAAADWKVEPPAVWIVGVAPPAMVDLEAPGALDRLAAENPDHYRRVLAMLEVAQNASCEDEAQIHKAREASNGIACRHATFKMSLPPKRSVTFPVDGVLYKVTLRIERFARFLDRE